jgi:hypothetical protein
MNRDRFQDLLDARGADLSAWPAADRAVAERLIAIDPGAAEALGETRRLDALIRRSLASVAPEAEREDIAARILSGLPKRLPAQEGRAAKRPAQPAQVRTAPKPWTFAPAFLWPPSRTAAFACAAGLGIALGVFFAQHALLDRNALMTSSAEADVTAVIFQTDSANGIF